MESADEKICPECAETVKAAAKKCRYCGHIFPQKPKWLAAMEEKAEELEQKKAAEEEEAAAALARGEKPKFKWWSGKGCMLIIALFFGLAILLDVSRRLSDPEGYAAEQQQKEESRIAAEAAENSKNQAETAAEAIAKANGQHCLSGWDGSNRDTVRQVKAALRNPDSFEHVGTQIYGNDGGEHGLWMTYRAQNGFGGMNIERIYARIDHNSCDARVLPGGPGSD